MAAFTSPLAFGDIEEEVGAEMVVELGAGGCWAAEGTDADCAC